jgi:putative salt-induced outer membrane protein YdiY
MHGMTRVRNPAAAAHLVSLARGAALAACLLAAAGPVMAADIDVVLLKNGDRLHGEIKNMQFGRLELSTTSMSTVYVEWNKVAGLTSPSFFEFELMDGSRYYGSLEPADAGTLGVTLEGRTNALDVAQVVRIRPIKSSFWDRIDGSISLGANYTRSSEIGQGSLTASVGTRRPAFELKMDFSTTITVQPDQPDQSRTAGSLSYVKLMRNRWFVPGTGKLERNTDLGLDLRSSVGGGIGRYFVQTNRSVLGAAVGLVLNRENPVDGDSTTNVEAFASASYEFFTYDTPKTSFDASFALFPSLNVGGRYRTEFSLALSREIVKNFTVGATAYDSFDNKPPAGSSSTHDFGISLNLGWTF